VWLSSAELEFSCRPGDQLLRIAHRQVLKKKLLDQREDRGVGSDAKRKRQHGNHREGGAAQQSASNTSDRAKDFDSRLPCGRADVVLDCKDFADILAGSGEEMAEGEGYRTD
jgi:hypothetical protein